jgi:hypothetical protein
MDHALRSSCRQRHVQSTQHQLVGKRGRHRPADDATAIRIEHDREIQKARPCRNIGDFSNPQQVRSFRGEVALDQIRRLTAIALDRGGDELAPAHHGQRECPWPQARHEHVAHRTCRARRHAQHGFLQSARRPTLRAATAVASPMHSNRWRRHPAARTWWQSDMTPGDRSRTGTLRRDRVRLPSEPGRRL